MQTMSVFFTACKESRLLKVQRSCSIFHAGKTVSMSPLSSGNDLFPSYRKGEAYSYAAVHFRGRRLRFNTRPAFRILLIPRKGLKKNEFSCRLERFVNSHPMNEINRGLFEVSFFPHRGLIPLVVFCLFCGISVALWQKENSHKRERLMRYTETAAGQIKTRIEGLMGARVAALRLLAERWVERTPPDFSSERFFQFADAFYTYFPGFFAINWINPEGVLQWVFPEKGTLTRGSSIFEIGDSKYGDTFRKVMHDIVIGTTPSSDLAAGNSIFHVLLPLIHNKEIQGCIDGVFELKMMMGIALSKDILNNYRVSIYEGDNLIFINGNPVKRGSPKGLPLVERMIRFPGKTWQLELAPKGIIKTTWSSSNLPFLAFGLTISTALSLILYFLIQRMQLYRKARDHALREITERKKAEETLRAKESQLEVLLAEIEAKNEELETFVYTVSHDLKTPIVTIEGFIGAFREDFGDQLTEDGDSYLQYISDATRKMETLINDLLELSRVGRLHETTTEFSFGDLVEEILANLHPLIHEKGITVYVQDNLPVIQGERKRMTQVMENLLSNAVKYIGSENPSPKIEIGVQEENGRKVFYVRDNGIGIDRKYYDTIFQVFQRLPQAKRIDEGTGIGLTTAQRIIEHHGGKIWLDSEPGKGTTFFFSLHDKEV